MTTWTIQSAKETYNLAGWAEGYFDVGQQGNLLVMPQSDKADRPLDLTEICAALEKKGIHSPYLIRFPHILQDRVRRIHNAFQHAIAKHQYAGNYRVVYPIKVNQEKTVVKELISSEVNVGLEAGSKAELIQVLSLSTGGEQIILCNGYKDQEYIRLALIGQKLGHRIYIIVEKPMELQMVLEEAANMQLRPKLGVRMKLASVGEGKWQSSGGIKSKFGLTTYQLLEVLDQLKQADRMDCLELLHFHLGSQVPDVQSIYNAVKECVGVYAELVQMGAPMGMLDVGGGLGIDYEGTGSKSFCSTNYGLKEYADAIVTGIAAGCERFNIAHPNIVSESGRALTAHHAVLIVEVCSVESHQSQIQTLDKGETGIAFLDQMRQEFLNGARRGLALYQFATSEYEEAQGFYTKGVLSLEQRAYFEELLLSLYQKSKADLNHAIKEEKLALDDINAILADKFICNFSLFQSIPDVWAFDQIFPILPIQNLHKEPTRRAVICDITCDSDGQISQYVDGRGLEGSVPMHEWSPDKSYRLGIFLVGAYQEILGDMHNLFGDTASMNVVPSGNGTFQFTEIKNGDRVRDVLSYVHFHTDELQSIFREQVIHADLAPEERRMYLSELEAGLFGYTYLEKPI